MNEDSGAPASGTGSHAAHEAPEGLRPPGFDPSRLSHHEQMLDAQEGCVPCKLCGGCAVITDAGPGAGYYIACGNSTNWNDSKGCLIDQRRLGGYAYNVRDWWNRLHSKNAPAERVERLHLVEHSFRNFVESNHTPFIRMPRSSALLLCDDLAEAISLVCDRDGSRDSGGDGAAGSVYDGPGLQGIAQPGAAS